MVAFYRMIFMATNESTVSPEQGRFKNSYLAQSWLVLLLAVLFGISLAGIQRTLGPVIESNKINETLEKVPDVILGQKGATTFVDSGGSLLIKPCVIEIVTYGREKKHTVLEARYSDGRLAGWVTKASGRGYADNIELLLGFEPDAKHITGLFILEQKETPGLGNKIIEKKWRDQFVKKSTDIRLKVVKGGTVSPEYIDAITGATISSKSVTDIVNRSVVELKAQLASLAVTKEKDR